MANKEWTVRGILRWVTKGKGLKEVRDEIRKTKKETSGLEQAFKGVGTALVASFSIDLVRQFVTASISNYASYERTLHAIEIQAEAVGIAHDGLRERVDRAFQSIERQAKILRQDVAPVYLELQALIKDVDGALLATRIATNASAAGWGSASETANRLGEALRGNAAKAAVEFGIEIDTSASKVDQKRELIEKLVEQFGTFDERLNDTTASLQSQHQTLNDLQHMLGEALAPAVDGVARSVGMLKNAIKLAALFFSLGVQEMVNRALASTAALKVLFDPSNLLSPASFRTAGIRAINAYSEELAKGAIRTVKTRGEILKIFMGDPENDPEVKRGLEALNEAIVESNEDALREAERLAEQRRRMNEATELAILRAQIDAAEEGSARRLELEKQFLDRRYEITLRHAQKLGADIQQLDELLALQKAAKDTEHIEFRKEQEARREEMAAQLEIDLKRLLLDAITADTIEAIEERTEIELELLREKFEEMKKIAKENGGDMTLLEKAQAAQEEKIVADSEEAKKQLARQKFIQRTELAGELVSTTFKAFGMEKEAAIAEAIVATMVAATKALDAGFPLGPILAAAITAQGLRNVQRIRDTDISAGKGFDVPEHDTLARMGGRRWADDMVRNLTMGLREGVEAADFTLGGSITNDNRVVDQRTYIGRQFTGPVSTFGSRTETRHLTRELKRAERRDRRRIIGRK